MQCPTGHYVYHNKKKHYSDIIMSVMASQISDVSIVYWIICSGADQRNHQSSVSVAFMRGIHRWPLNSPHKGPVTRKMFPFGDVTVNCWCLRHANETPFTILAIRYFHYWKYILYEYTDKVLFPNAQKWYTHVNELSGIVIRWIFSHRFTGFHFRWNYVCYGGILLTAIS